MKILLSPAKLMSLESEGKWNKSATPIFIDRSQTIMEQLKKLKTKELEKLMSISKELAEMNRERNQAWNVKPASKESLQAILAFQGEAFRGLDPVTLDEKSQNWLDEHLLILSGLYGILRPKDRIMLYRLEMGSRFPVNDSKNLYGFWKSELTDFVNKQLKNEEILLNLSSNEYSKVIDDKKLKSPKVEVKFLDFKNGKLKPIMAYFKNARGRMARYCAENQVSTLDEIKLFNEERYAYDENLSSENELVFVR
jgi:cytoplasmic iron level regulating protein YaaA (DUF328/UPF0246 family)